MYKAIFRQGNTSEYFNEDELLFIVKRKFLFFIKETCTVYRNKDKILKFTSSEFMFFYWKINILEQKLDKFIYLKKIRGRYNLIINDKRIFIKFANNPLKKVIGTVYYNDECIGEIEKHEANSKTNFLFIFNENIDIEFYVLILFSMCSVGITDSI